MKMILLEDDWMYLEKIGGIIRNRRKELGMNQVQLAHSANVSQGYIADLENGKVKNPTVKTITKIAAVLNLNNELLLNEAGISAGEINSDILELAKMSQKLTPEQRQKMIAVTKALFPEIFDDKK
jgi:transcriptional regulator with XRE-family HTH domain